MPKHPFSRHDVVLIDGKPGAIKLVDEWDAAPMPNGVKVEMFDDRLPEKERYFWIGADDPRLKKSSITYEQWFVLRLTYA